MIEMLTSELSAAVFVVVMSTLSPAAGGSLIYRFALVMRLSDKPLKSAKMFQP